MKEPNTFDHLLSDEGPAALVLRQYLTPVEGPDGVLFPSTYASGDGFPGGYNIDTAPDGKNVCLVDSAGSQANRIEPLFKEDKYKHLVPQVVVKAGDKEVNILDAGHRAGDAIVRCSELQIELQNAFNAVLKGNAGLLARIAPTSLVFGVWDSRDTQAKLPRLVSSTIRAFNVKKLTRSAQYTPAIRYTEVGMLEVPGVTKDTYSQRGFLDAPATATHGGVIAESIRRDATLALAALKLVSAGSDEKKTTDLRRYILGLALTAFTYRPAGYLRQGCLLVLNPEPPQPHEFVEVFSDGKRKPCMITHEQAIEYATAAAKAFVVGPGKTVSFDPERAKKDLQGEGNTGRILTLSPKMWFRKRCERFLIRQAEKP